ncbi:MAG: hypothetical protein CBC12_05145 [Candidatus Puniceispirillum sp. TMED52]|nr:MAG: hypothetical protein CBC12_05145 [Candidatus Puniceispirillum sp. TMED52]
MCAYCLVTSDDVEPMATCMAKCSVMAHPDCFEKRFTTHVYRKKHSSRGNDDFELCPMKNCNAKLKIKAKKGTGNATFNLPDVKGATNDIIIDDSMCGFPMKDGRPCTRTANKYGACKLHAHDALVKKKMVSLLEMDTGCVPCTISGSVSVETQCDGVPSRAKAIQTDAASTTNASTQTGPTAKMSPEVVDKMRCLEEENVRLKNIISALQARESDATIKNASEVASAITNTRRKTLTEVAKTIERMRLC